MLRRSFLSGIAFVIRRDQLDRAKEICLRSGTSGEVTFLAAVVQQGRDVMSWSAGRARPDTVFLLASITKPMTAVAVMKLADRGELRLSDHARKFIPEFKGGDRDLITVRHLLTHTSGLPDMLPENEQLRKRHAPLADFVAGTCSTPLLFKPGTEVRYQSMGILLAAEIAERVTRTPLRRFLAGEVFRPLGMTKTSLGLGGRRIEDTAICQVTGNDDWNWNSPYWRDLGAPWGGAHANAADILKLLAYFLDPDDRVLKPATARAMTTNQNHGLPEPWGFGFLVNGARFGKKCSPGTFGHWGSTGTIAWCDPVTRTSFVLLTTKPASDSRRTLLGPVSDAVAEASA